MPAVDGTPLPASTATSSGDSLLSSSIRSQGLRQAARIIRQASTVRQGLTEPSMAVRETAAQEIEDRQDGWAYSRAIVGLDVAWNSAFIVAAVVGVLITESHSPLRLWVSGYALQCLVHLVCVCVEYRRRRSRRIRVRGCDGGGEEGLPLLQERYVEESSALMRHIESANTTFSFVWWIIGFYWVLIGGRSLQEDCPTLYWLCIAFLVLDLFFVMLCLALASLIAAAVCCCLPCIIGILYILTDRGGASKEDIELLPKYTFHRIGSEEKGNEETPTPCGGIMKECGTDIPIERSLTADDAECCICLSAYEDGIELRELPCCHHFHCTCIDKWLYINSTCPLCKYDILKQCSQDEVV